jgi:hypothetical protein
MFEIIANVSPEAIPALAILGLILMLCGALLLWAIDADDLVSGFVGALLLFASIFCLIFAGQGKGEENRALPDFEKHCRGAILLSLDPSDSRKEDVEHVTDELHDTMGCEVKIDTIEGSPFPEPEKSRQSDTSKK